MKRWADAAKVRIVSAWPALLPGALVLFFAFRSGGFFPGAVGLAAGALAIGLALRTTLGRRPFAALSAPVAIAAGALGAYAVWALLSATWSDAPGRALLEFDRGLLYGLALLLCATFPQDPHRLAVAVRFLVAAVFAACLVGWLGRVLPEVITVSPGAAPDRLSYPLTYWNAQGLFAGIGLLLAAHLVTSRHEPEWVRALGAAAVPLLVSTLYFTFSRGAFLATAVGLVAYVALVRSRALLLGGLVALPPAVVAVIVSYDASELGRRDPVRQLVVEQGRAVAVGIAACSVVALLLRLAVSRWLEGPVERVVLPDRARRPVRLAALALGVAVLVALPVALGAPGQLARGFDRFVEGDVLVDVDQRTRILNPGNNGRLDNWRVALETFSRHPVRGTGAGTYETEWNQQRASDLKVVDGHSLYLETLSDLGVVGFACLMTALVAIIGGVGLRAVRRRGVDRSLDAVILATMVAWGLQSGLDWFWEMPAVTVWVFALGGLALARPVTDGAPSSPGRIGRVAIALGCLVLAVVPLQVARSQALIDRSVQRFEQRPRDCPGAIDAALGSLSVIGARPEPWEVIAYCDVGAGESRLAVAAARNAVERDPRNWEFRYALALVRGSAGEDPRPDARLALRLNPRLDLLETAVRRFAEARPTGWPAVARDLRLPDE